MVLVNSAGQRRYPTVAGFAAVLLWSTLAVLTEGTGKIPPFQLTAMCLFPGGVTGLAIYIRSPGSSVFQKMPLYIWALGIYGIFGYHFFYFTALRNSPAVEAGLIAYLWPILIVLLSSLLPGERIRFSHIAGAVLGLTGAAIIVSKGGTFAFQSEYAIGYMMAALCAVTWSSYSVLSRKFSAFPTNVITSFCLAGAALSLACHLVLEQTVMPQGSVQWICIVLLGTGPTGLAFYLWDYGVKHGDIQVLGALSYMAPMISTVFLILAGFAKPEWYVLAASVLITAGAVIASHRIFIRRS